MAACHSKVRANQKRAWLILMRMGEESLQPQWLRRTKMETSWRVQTRWIWRIMLSKRAKIWHDDWAKTEMWNKLKWLFCALPLLPTSTNTRPSDAERKEKEKMSPQLLQFFFFFFLSMSITCRANCFPCSLWFNASLINNVTGRAEWILIDYISHFWEATICAGEAVGASGRRDTDAEAKGEERDGETEEENRVCKTEDVRVSWGRAD